MNFIKGLISFTCAVCCIVMVSLSSVQSAAEPPVSSCVAAPDPVTYIQPDGSEIEIIGKGNIHESYTETLDGYTLVRNDEGYYVYAVLDEEGQLAPSDLKPHSIDKDDAQKRSQLDELDISPGLRPEVDRETIAPGKNDDDLHGPHETQLTIEADFPSEGEHKVLLLLIEYPNLEAEYNPEAFEAMMNEEDYTHPYSNQGNTGSFRDYYLENSLGKLDLQIDVTGWYMARQNYQYYGRQFGYGRSRELVAEAVDAAYEDGIDFSKYDNTGDGEVDGILVVHSGPGAEQGSNTQYIWSHRSRLHSHSRTYNGVKIDNYAIQPETRGNLEDFTLVGIGIFAHEFGHVLGLPDLYDTSQESNGIGNWGVMGSGGWLGNEHSPSHFTPWSKIDLGWAEADNLFDEDFSVTLPPVYENNKILKVPTLNEHEYFLLETRRRIGFDRALPGEGLAVWHINEDVINFNRNSNSINTQPDQYGVGLVQANNNDDLENKINRGAPRHLYPTFNNNEFSENSGPEAVLHDGTFARFGIYNIQEQGNDITFQYDFYPEIAFTLSDEVCKKESLAINNESLLLEDFEWDFGDENIYDEYMPDHNYSVSGTFEVSLTGRDIKDRKHTKTHEVTVKPLPHTEFEYTHNSNGEVVVNNLAVQDAEAFYWEFSGQTSTEAAPVFEFNRSQYENRGDIPELIMVATKDQCSDTLRREVYRSNFDERIANAFPNPFMSEMNIAFDLPSDLNEGKKVSLRIIDPSGQVYAQKEVFADELQSNAPFRWDLSALAPSLYLLEVSFNDKRELYRVVKEGES